MRTQGLSGYPTRLARRWTDVYPESGLTPASVLRYGDRRQSG